MAINAYGWAIGQLNILDEFGNLLGFYHGKPDKNRDQEHWMLMAFDLHVHTKLFVIEAVKGGTNHLSKEGDLCVDNVMVYEGTCGRLTPSSSFLANSLQI